MRPPRESSSQPCRSMSSGFAFVIEFAFADQLQQKLKSLGGCDFVREFRVGESEGALGFKDGGCDFGEGAVRGFAGSETAVCKNFGEVSSERFSEVLFLKALQPAIDPFEAGLDLWVLRKITFRSDNGIVEAVGRQYSRRSSSLAGSGWSRLRFFPPPANGGGGQSRCRDSERVESQRQKIAS